MFESEIKERGCPERWGDAGCSCGGESIGNGFDVETGRAGVETACRACLEADLGGPVLDLAAMLSFYFVLSIFPFLLFLVSLLGLLLQPGGVVI